LKVIGIIYLYMILVSFPMLHKSHQLPFVIKCFFWYLPDSHMISNSPISSESYRNNMFINDFGIVCYVTQMWLVTVSVKVKSAYKFKWTSSKCILVMKRVLNYPISSESYRNNMFIYDFSIVCYVTQMWLVTVCVKVKICIQIQVD
jgi:hypothetical protein